MELHGGWVKDETKEGLVVSLGKELWKATRAIHYTHYYKE